MSLNRKMRRQLERQTKSEVTVKVDGADVKPFGMTKAGYNAIYQAGFEAGVKAEREKLTLYYARYFTHQILAVCCKILMEHYGEIHVRKTRLEKFVELYGRGLEMLGDDESTEQYLRYIESYGIHINWKEPET